MSGSFQQLTVDVPEALKDAVIGELFELGAAGFWENGEPSPGVTRLEIYFDRALNLEDVRLRVRSLFERASLPSPSTASEDVADRDWLGEWKKSYVSFPIGVGFYVVPSWSESACPPERKPIRIDPGQAFGTGTHETTQLTLGCLEEQAGRLNLDVQILDLGTGSGILMIAARLLGFQRIAGCDIDLDSIVVALENFERNDVQGLSAFCGSIDATPTKSVDLLLCNLTADVITLLFPEIIRALRPGAGAILSGILVEQRGQICDLVTASGWTIEDDRTRGEWIALVIRKPA